MPEAGAPLPALETEVPVAALKIGDLIALRPGDRVPVDGLVIEGDSAVDEAMLTGESVPVDKSAKSELYTGTVNLNGRLVLQGGENGRGWSATIDEANGVMSAAVVDEDHTFSLFGACTTP